MARTEAVQKGRRRRADAVSSGVRGSRIAKALRLLERNADRMHFSAGREEWEKLGARNGRIWSAIGRFGIDDDVLAGLRAIRGSRPAPRRNWRRAI